MSTPQSSLSNLFVVQLPLSLLWLLSKLSYFHFVVNALRCSLFIIDLTFATVYSVVTLYMYFTCMHFYDESCSQYRYLHTYIAHSFA